MNTLLIRLHGDEQTETYKQLVRNERQHGYMTVGCHVCVDRTGGVHIGRPKHRPSMYDKDRPDAMAVLVLVDPLKGVTEAQKGAIDYAIHHLAPGNAEVEHAASWHEGYPRWPQFPTA